MFEEKVGRRLAWSRGTRPETRFGEDVRLAWSRGRGGCVDAARRTARRWEWTASRCMVSKRKRVVLRLRQLPLCLCWVIRRTVFVANAVCCLIRIHSTTPAFDGWRMDESEPAISANFKFVPIPSRTMGLWNKWRHYLPCQRQCRRARKHSSRCVRRDYDCMHVITETHEVAAAACGRGM